MILILDPKTGLSGNPAMPRRLPPDISKFELTAGEHLMVTARLLPRRFCFDASNKLFVVDKSV
ncbi:hypothetical protein AAIH70_26275, partial [Neorhizobium sp. BT27B]|uniref:hypothetical protein n=1 Tax=Neorhizobium sp. BT27B TaxID=3142625 RepID=UPI003D26B88B